MAQRIVQVDAFTSERYRGNPAAVCILQAAAEPGWMQLIAREMNLSETAFLVPNGDGYHLRWFTPATEVDLCGHATLASAHVLWEEGHLRADQPALFQTLSGELTARKDGDWIELDFPAEPVAAIEPQAVLSQALGSSPRFVGRNRMDLFVELDDEQTVRSVQPDMSLLRQIEARGVVVTSRSSTAEFDFVSRFFGPAVGIDEDPVTGSSHCGLGPYWGGRLDKEQMTGYQASARGGVVRVRLAGNRVRLGGQAVTVMRGELV
jgi:PhzF family phenazine biosynthesis protein